MKRRLFAILLTLCLLLGLLPGAALAAEPSAYTVTVPTGCTVQVGTLKNSYVYTPVQPETVDGTGYTYQLTPGTTYYCRVSKPGDDAAVTCWKWFSAAANGSLTVTEADLAPQVNGRTATSATIVNDLSVNRYDTGSMLLTANAAGCLQLAQGETHTLNVFRSWQAIENFMNSKIAEPDYHCQVLDAEGQPSDAVTAAANPDNSGEITLRANHAGLAIVVVYYDAMTSDVAQGGSFLSASWPENAGVVLVDVDGTDGPATGLTLNAGQNSTTNKLSGDAIDAELDVLYDCGGDGASLSFTPASGSTVSVLRPTLTDRALTYTGWSSEGVSEAAGVFTVSGLPAGKNVIRVTRDGKSSYQVVSVRHADVQLYADSKLTQPLSAADLHPGDSCYARFRSVLLPANKLATIYNMSGTLTLTGEDGAQFKGKAAQYDFAASDSAQTVAITIPKYQQGSTYSLTGTVAQGGFGSPYGSHRATTYATGKSPDFSALPRPANLGQLQGITVSFTPGSFLTAALQLTDGSGAAVTGVNVTLKDSTGASTKVSDDYTAAVLPGETYTYTITCSGYNDKNGSFTVPAEQTEPYACAIALEAKPQDIHIRIYDYTAVHAGLTGASESGVVLDTTVSALPSTSTAQVIRDALDENNISYTISDTQYGTYISAVNGLSAGDGGSMSGWLTAYNGDRFTNWGVDTITLHQDDTLELHYSLDGGTDIGSGSYGLPILTSVRLNDVTVALSKQTDWTTNTTSYYMTGSQGGTRALAGQGTQEHPFQIPITLPAGTDLTQLATGWTSCLDESYASVDFGTLENGSIPVTLRCKTGGTTWYVLKPTVAAPIDDPETLTVSFRLIGATRSAGDIDLGTNDYQGAEYVTWIPTQTVSVARGTTAGQLTARQLSAAGLRCEGLEDGYISTIYAPEVCGGYALSEFTNGTRSGWMFTVNGKHPNQSLKDCVLHNDDVVILHYVNDYAHELADWFDDPDYPAQGDGSHYDAWLQAADESPADRAAARAVEEKIDAIGTVDAASGPAIAAARAAYDGLTPAQQAMVANYGTLTAAEAAYAALPQPLPFTDVDGHWALSSIRYVYENGLMNGVGSGRFQPEGATNRAMIVTVLYRLAGSPAVTAENPYSDVPQRSWYTNAVLWGTESGVVNGIGGGKFAPLEPITREQLAAMLFRFAASRGDDVAPRADLSAYTDAGSVHAFAQEALRWANAQGIVNGYPNGRIAPQGSATRAEAATMLARFCRKYA